MKFIPKTEKIKKHEIVISVIIILLDLLIFELIRFNRTSKDCLGLLVSIPLIIALIFIIPKMIWVIKIRFNKLYNSIIWLLLTLIYLFIGLYLDNIDYSNKKVIEIFYLPICFYGYYHIMRIIHILLYNKEPIFAGRADVNSYEKEEKRIIADSDMSFGLIYGLIGLILFVVILLNL